MVIVIVERVARQDTHAASAEGDVGEQGVWVGLDGAEHGGHEGGVDTVEVYERESRVGADGLIGLAATEAHGYGEAQHTALEQLGMALVAGSLGHAVAVGGYLQRVVAADELDEAGEAVGLGRLVGEALESVDRVHGFIV